MLQFIKDLFGSEKADYGQLVQNGVIILAVRSEGEFSGGHIRGSINISLEKLGSNLPQLKKRNKQIITCCAFGLRSASPKSLLKSNGFTEVYNGGAWNSLKIGSNFYCILVP